MMTRSVERRVWSAAAVAVLAVANACSGASGATPGPVVTLAESGGSNPTVAVDAGGAGVVAWVGEAAEGEWNVYGARTEDGGATFSAPVRVNDQPGDATPHDQAPAQVAVGPEGNVYVLWQKKTPVEWLMMGAADLRLARSTDGGRSWEPAITVNDDADGAPARHSFHNLVVAADGTVYVSWIDARERDGYRGEQARKEAAAGRPTRHQHGQAQGEGQRQWAASDPNEPGTDLRVARSTDGGRSFGAAVVVDTNTCPCCRTSLAVAPDGALYVAWRKIYEGDVRDIAVARSSDGGLTWEAPVRVHGDEWVFPGCPHTGPSLAVDGRGDLHVAWYTGREGRQGMWYSVSSDGARSFAEPMPLLTGEWVPASQVKLASRGGETWIAWDDRREDATTLSVARVARRGRAPQPLQWEQVTGGSPALAVAAGGPLIAWHDAEAVRARRSGGSNGN